MKFFLIFLVAVLASSSSFIIHVVTIEWLPLWIGEQMKGITIQPSWNVRYIASITSLEYGIAAIVLYYLARNKLIVFGKLKSAIIFSILLMAIHGAFLRQAFMDYVIGNPLHVVIVQNSFKYLGWILMSFCVVYGIEFIIKITNNKKSIN